MPDTDLLCRARSGQVEIRQVCGDALRKIDDAALHLLQDQRRGQDFGDRSKKESSVLTHRRTRDDVC
jgi:hypothetical protein